MIKTGPATIQLSLTEDELKMLGYAMASFQALSHRAPLIVGQVSRSDAMSARRKLDRFAERISSLLTAYGITL